MVSTHESASSTSSSTSSAPDPRTAANRRNARKSTGPKTPEGKARSRLNAVRHGLCATVALLRGDDDATFEAFADGIYASFKPRDAAEAMLVDQYISIGWRLRRVGDAEMALNEDEFRGRLRSAAFEYANRKLNGGQSMFAAALAGAKTKKKLIEPEREIDPKDLELPHDQWPKELTGGEMLASEFRDGDGPLLRMMAQEDRLRRTLTQTMRQIKELRALRRAMNEEDDAEAESDRPPVWERRRSTDVDVMPFRADGTAGTIDLSRAVSEAFALRDADAEEESEVQEEEDEDDEEAEDVAEETVRNEPTGDEEPEAQVATDSDVSIEPGIVRNEANSIEQPEAQVAADSEVSAETNIVRNEANSGSEDPGLRCAAPPA